MFMDRLSCTYKYFSFILKGGPKVSWTKKASENSTLVGPTMYINNDYQTLGNYIKFFICVNVHPIKFNS